MKNDQKRITNQFVFKSFSSLLLLSAIVFGTTLVSCNDDGKGKSASADNTNKSDQDTDSLLAHFDGNFPYLLMLKTELDNYFVRADPVTDLQKLIFRFQFDDENSLPSLAYYGGITVRTVRGTGPLSRLRKTPFRFPVRGEFQLGNLEISRELYDLLITRSGYSTSTYLVFSPKRSSQNNLEITYSLSWDAGEILTQGFIEKVKLTGDDMKPSPPAPPAGPN